MKKILLIYKNLKQFIGKYLPIVFGMLAIVLFALSFQTRSYQSVIGDEVKKVEKSVHKRQDLMDSYVLKALNTPNDEWLDFDMPEDMVLYKYCGDTIQSWINGFPISNDEVDVYPFMYRLQYMSNGNLYSTPLAYIGMEESYVNFGSAWYIVNTHIDRITRAKVISGILVRTEYEAEGVTNKVNENLSFDNGFMSVPITTDDSAIVYGSEGRPLFSIVPIDSSVFTKNNMAGKWLAFFFGLAALFVFHLRNHTKRSFSLLVGGAVLIRIAAALITTKLTATEELFSPVLFASNALAASLGDFLLNTILISLTVYGLFVIRIEIYRKLMSAKKINRIVAICLLSAYAVFLIVYIHTSLNSLIDNSNIVLEPFRLNELTGYSILCFVSFAMLFLALLYLLQMIVISCRFKKKFSLLDWREIVCYILIVSVYTVAVIGLGNMHKEYETSRVWTNKLAVERDLNLELQLMGVEEAIATDPFIAMLTTIDNRDFILRRLLERYLYRGIDQKYNIELTVCSPNNLLVIGSGVDPVACFPFYQEQISRYGIPLTNNGMFYFMSNYDGQSSYLGVFTYVDYNTMVVNRLFIEIKSKFAGNSAGYDFFSESGDYNIKLPRQYSFARYSNDRLVQYGGNYSYPVFIEKGKDDVRGYSRVVKKGYIHFINYLSEGETTMVSRPTHSLIVYLISFSYYAIAYGLFILFATRKGRKRHLLDLPRHSLRRKITLLTTLSMIAALLSMGAASIIYTANNRNETNKDRLENVIQTVSSSLSEYCSYVNRYVDLNNVDFLNGLSDVATVAQVDINIYDTHGGLIRSTKPEVFEQYYMGKRMNNKAFHEIVHNHELKYIAVETIANIRYFSVYAPLFNIDGEMVAIVNVPYFSKAEDLNETANSAMATIINLYLILLLSAIVIAAFISNQMSRPLAEIKRRMETISASGSNARIRYNNTKDELGVLVSAYNKMVDDLEESTRQLAKSEREEAWTEMARQIAHEIKNPLTPMRLSIQHLMRMKKANVEGWEDKLDTLSRSLLDQIDILSETASAFSSFAKMFSEEVVDVNLNELIEENIILFKSNEQVRFEFDTKVKEPIVAVREKQLSRVFVNLITNAVQALEGIDEAIVKISLYQDDTHYCVDIEDNGNGVADENLDKLFKPNFTTKSSGTGLGLAISYNIIEQSNGELSYRKSSLGGACFSICLSQK